MTTGGSDIVTSGLGAALDFRLRDQTAASASAGVTADRLAAVESILGEPSDTGLASRLDALWNAWGALALGGVSGPELLHAAGRVAATLHEMAAALTGIADAVELDLAEDVDALAATASGLAESNRAAGSPDERPALLLAASALAGVSATVGAHGAVRVTLDGQPLVTGTTAAAVSSTGPSLSVDGSAVTVTSGRIAAHTTLLTRTLPTYRATLDAVARALVAGPELFTGDGAARLRVAVAAPADVDVDLSQSALRPGSADGIFAALVGNVATASAVAARRARLLDAVRGQLAGQRSSPATGARGDVAAVRAHEQALHASSRVFTAVDGMLDSLLGHVGTTDERSGNRITATGTDALSLAAARAASARLTSLQARVATGRRITTSSDDPDGTVTAMALRSALARHENYDAACDDALARLAAADVACAQGVSFLQRARLLVAQATSARDRSACTAVAAQLDELLEAATDTVDIVRRLPRVTRLVAARTVVFVGMTGTDLFGDPVTGIYAELREMASALRVGPVSSSSSVPDRVDATLARVGAMWRDVVDTRDRVQRITIARVADDLALRTRLAEIEDVDLADIAMRTAAANAAYHGALRTISQAEPLSLPDFLR